MSSAGFTHQREAELCLGSPPSHLMTRMARALLLLPLTAGWQLNTPPARQRCAAVKMQSELPRDATQKPTDVSQAAADIKKTLLTKSSLDLSKVYRRAEPWDSRTATLLEVVNVVGRFEDCESWSQRKQFSEPIVDKSAEDAAGTEKRAEFAKRHSQAERRAFKENVATLPFTNTALAASVGKTVDDFAALPSEASLMVVFDVRSHGVEPGRLVRSLG